MLGVYERCRIFAVKIIKRRMMMLRNLSILLVVDVLVVLCCEA
jgi:hypothetical protein